VSAFSDASQKRSGLERFCEASLSAPLRHRGRVPDASFSADGRFVITGNHEGCRVWDAATGRLLMAPLLPGRGDGWGRAALTADNRRLVTLDSAYVDVWDDVLAAAGGPAEELVSWARLVAGHRIDAGGLVPLEPAALRDALLNSLPWPLCTVRQ
jgi:hypothetical protein